MQDDCVLKMIVDFAGVDLGVAARSLAQVVEREEAELQEQQQAAAGPSGRPRRASARGKTVASAVRSAYSPRRSRFSRPDKIVVSDTA